MKFAAFILTFAFFVMPKCMAANGIAVTGNGTNSALNLTANFSGAVANVTETFDTSSKPTYIVSAFSANAGLKNGASVVPYTVSYACAAAVSTTVTISTMDQQIASRYNPPSASSCTGTISISFSGAAASQLYQGTYSDNITFSYRRNGSLVSTQALTLTSQVVGSTVSLTINGNAVASSLPLTTVQTNLLVGTATEASNSNTGYLIQARSANAGKLMNAASNLTYTLMYGASGAISLTTSNVTVYTVPAGLYSSNSSNLTISYTPPALMAPGTYSDVITFTIAAQ